MNHREIEERLDRAIRSRKPDLLEHLMQETVDASYRKAHEPAEEKTGAVGFTKSSDRIAVEFAGGNPAGRRKRSIWYRTIAVAACMVLVFAGGYALRGQQTPVSVPARLLAHVTLDVNPGIDIEIDEGEQVISAEAVNEEGRLILQGMPLEGVPISVACNAIVGAMFSQGYLSDTSNSILVSVQAADQERGRQIENELSSCLNTYLEQSRIAGSILGRYETEDPGLTAYAREHGITPGKAGLIRSLQSLGDPKLSEASLLKLSTQELILLGQEKQVAAESSYGTADKTKYISRESALQKAVEYTGVKPSKITEKKTAFECEDGIIIYEVEFRSGGTEYEVELNAVTGEVLAMEQEAPEREDDSDDSDEEDEPEDFDEEDE